MIKQVEESIIQEDDKIKIKEIITKVIYDDGTYDVYRDTIVTHKNNDEEYQTEHSSCHRSGCHNNDYIGSESTTHIHERKDGSTYAYDENKNGEKDYEPYSN